MWVCEEGIGNYKFASRCGEWGLDHIYQQLSELLACILLDDEVIFLVILERNVYFFCDFSLFWLFLLLSLSHYHMYLCGECGD